jgi:hypothetical protein
LFRYSSIDAQVSPLPGATSQTPTYRGFWKQQGGRGSSGLADVAVQADADATGRSAGAIGAATRSAATAAPGGRKRRSWDIVASGLTIVCARAAPRGSLWYVAAVGLASRLGALRDAMDRDLRENVLPFWIREGVDERHGGLRGYVSDEGVASPLAPKGGVLCARILWTYAAALRRTGDDAHRRMADRAYAYLRDRFFDPEHGGTYWMLDHAGRPLADRKQTYALAFGVYALAEYHRATGSAETLERAVALHRSIEAHAADPACGGSGTTSRRAGCSSRRRS